MKEIEKLESAFCRAFAGISLDPEARASLCVTVFSAELREDLDKLGANAGGYLKKYIAYLTTWAERKSRCLSTMVTGPANFPIARNNKANISERNAWEEFRAWRTRYINRANKESPKLPEEELDDALAQLEKEKEYHHAMLGINKIIRTKKSQEEIKAIIKETYGWDETVIADIGRYGFESFILTNHNAKIKRLEGKVLAIKARIQRRDIFELIPFPGGSISIEADRVIIKHDAKPAPEIIANLKARGFRWSGAYKSWSRKHTSAALRVAREICGGEGR